MIDKLQDKEFFRTDWTADDNDTAFASAVMDQTFKYGCGRRTGTIAEKQEYHVFPTPTHFDVTVYNQLEEYIWTLRNHEKINNVDKPAGCIRTDLDTYAFFGWARSKH